MVVFNLIFSILKNPSSYYYPFLSNNSTIKIDSGHFQLIAIATCNLLVFKLLFQQLPLQHHCRTLICCNEVRIVFVLHKLTTHPHSMKRAVRTYPSATAMANHYFDPLRYPEELFQGCFLLGPPLV